jgi:hypothetical protein
VYHTYAGTAPNPFVVPYHYFLLERTPKGEPPEARAWRKDEYPDFAPKALARGEPCLHIQTGIRRRGGA